MSKTAVILFGHGARYPKWEEPIRALAEKLAIDLVSVSVSVAFLQFGNPKLEETIETKVASGAKRIVVLPFFLASGGHLISDLPNIIAKAKKSHPEVKFDVSSPLGEHALVKEAMQKACVDFTQKG